MFEGVAGSIARELKKVLGGSPVLSAFQLSPPFALLKIPEPATAYRLDVVRGSIARMLTKLFGSETASAVKKTSATRWNAAPYVLGAMSAAAPGAQPSRRILTEPIGSLFLAGEAAHETLWGTVDGAWESGERAAEAALRKIGALKDVEPAPAPARPARPSRRAPQRSASPYN